MANKPTFKNSKNIIAMAINRSPTNCPKCPVRDICPLEYDGNAEYSEEQARKASYVMLQFEMFGTLVETVAKDPTQTQPLPITIPAPEGIIQLVRMVAATEGIIDPPGEVIASTEAVSPNVPAARA